MLKELFNAVMGREKERKREREGGKCGEGMCV
jgi:hypothetical protein